jgi:hypothetical protein
MDRTLVWSALSVLACLLLMIQLVVVGVWENASAPSTASFREARTRSAAYLPKAHAFNSASGSGSARSPVSEPRLGRELRENSLTRDTPSEQEVQKDDLLVVWSSGDSQYQLWQSALLACTLRQQAQPHFLRILHRSVEFRRHRQMEQRRFGASKRFPRTDQCM